MEPQCWWVDDGEKWSSDCDEAFQFTNDGPDENGFKYCPYCGSVIRITTQAEVDELKALDDSP